VRKVEKEAPERFFLSGTKPEPKDRSQPRKGFGGGGTPRVRRQEMRRLRPEHGKAADGFEMEKSEHADAMITAAHKQFPGPGPSELLRSVLAINSSQFCNTVDAGGD